MAESPGKRIAVRAHQLARGVEIDRLPDPDQLSGRTEAERHEVLEGLRVELFAVSSILADACLTRARSQRPSFPPYGLVRSRHTELRMIVANPDPVAKVDSFLALGKAYVDTTVYHLHGTFAALPEEGRGWLVERLGQLLELFKVGAGPATRSRMRDPVSFVYGGLQFGTGVSVQLAEVMAAMLAGDPTLAAADRAAILTRSSSPAYDIAAYSVTEVLRAYQRLQSPTRRSISGTSSQSWMDPAHFVIRESEGRPWRIELADDDLLGPPPPEAAGMHTYTTLGCPARISPSAGTSPIAGLWSWCIELAHDTGLLGPPAPPR